ncbi:MAG: DedA family protein [Clostridium fessum]
MGKTAGSRSGRCERCRRMAGENGTVSRLFCRFVPIIRSLISIPAGMAKMELLPFLLLTTAGSLIWNTVLIGAGAVAGHRGNVFWCC